MSVKVLIVDDDTNICELLRLYLEKEGYSTVIANDGEEAVEAFKNNSPDIILLDVMLPKLDGWQVCREIRKTSQVPIIMLTAKGETFDKVFGLELGADDYVTKPFSLKVLMHRIDTLLKRGTGIVRTDDSLSLDGILIKPSAHDVFLNGELLSLTLKEYKILTKLTSHLGRVYTREQLLDEVWGIEYAGDTRTVDSHVARLRTKLGEWGIKHIKTIYGTGYKAE